MRLGIDILGNVAILKFDRDVKASEKKRKAQVFLNKHKSVSTVLEKSEKFSGRLRTQKTKHLAGDKTKEALYKENGCVFRFNVDSCYFSPRLSSERKEIAGKVKKGENVLVMFGGAAPFAVVMGKLSKAGRIVSIELGKECNKYAKINVKRNKLEAKVEIVQGNVRRVIGKGKKISEKFDRIVMTRPNLEDSFLDVAFSACKKGTIVHYYGFSPPTQAQKKKELTKKQDVDDIRELKKLVLSEARKAKRKVKILGVKKAGDIGPYRFRYRADFRIL